MKKIAVIALLISTSIISSAYAQQSITKMQSLYIYNFIKNIKWKNIETKYVVGVFASDGTVTDITDVLGIRKVNGKSIEVKKISSVTEAGNCQVVFVSDSFKSNIPKMNNPAIHKNTLIISEKGGLDNGVSIAFILENSKLKFKINEQVCKASGLQISATLLSLSQ